MKKLLALFLCLLLSQQSAIAGNTLIPMAGAGISGPASGAPYSGPGDVVAGGIFWYGLRAYSNALANAGATTTKVMDVRGATSGSCTIFLLGNGTGGIDLTTAGVGGLGNQCVSGATTFCTVTNASCSVSKIYDQVAANNCVGTTSCDVVQATAGNQPTLTFSAVGGNAAISCAGGSSQSLQSANNFLGTSASYSMSLVSKFTGSTQSAVFAANGGTPQIGSGIVAGDYFGYASTVVEIVAAASVFHALQIALAAGNDAYNIDGTDTTGVNFGGSSWLSNPILLCSDGSHPWTGVFGEVGYWPATFSAGQRSSMNSNQHNFWGF